ncbi:hypothetical protein QTH73_09740 [Clostridium perfringens]|nr:hypothetical protein [Clostridium perfringens]
MAKIIREQKDKVVLEVVFEKLKSTSIKGYSLLIDYFLPYIDTNMSSMDRIKLATEAAPLVKGSLETARFLLDYYCDEK